MVTSVVVAIVLLDLTRAQPPDALRAIEQAISQSMNRPGGPLGALGHPPGGSPGPGGPDPEGEKLQVVMQLIDGPIMLSLAENATRSPSRA